jgi:hypothetical protein
MMEKTHIDLELFEEKYQSGQMYHRRANQFSQEGQVNSVVFNVASVALENYLIALCELYGVEPGNHNYTCLMDSVQTIVAVPPELNKEIRSLDEIFGICSLDNYYHGIPEDDDSGRVLSMCIQVQGLFDLTRISAVRATDQAQT